MDQLPVSCRTELLALCGVGRLQDIPEGGERLDQGNRVIVKIFPCS